MTPEKFKHIVDRVVNVDIPPFAERLEKLRKEAAALESTLEQQQLVQKYCQYLVNGETMAGFLGASPTYGMFVRQYRAEPSKFTDRFELMEVDLVIIPDLLVEHVLRVNIPNPTRPGVTTNTPQKVDVSGIVRRMLDRARNAKNVSVGTFADVLCEMCTDCGRQAPVVAFDEFRDDDNGRLFSVNRLCGACSRVVHTAYYHGQPSPRDSQYRLTDGIYR